MFSVAGERYKFQKFQPQVPTTQQPSLLDLPGVADHATFTRERHLDCPQGADHSVRKTGVFLTVLLRTMQFPTFTTRLGLISFSTQAACKLDIFRCMILQQVVLRCSTKPCVRHANISWQNGIRSIGPSAPGLLPWLTGLRMPTWSLWFVATVVIFWFITWCFADPFYSSLHFYFWEWGTLLFSDGSILTAVTACV